MSKFVFVDVFQVTGLSKKTGTPFKMNRASVLVPSENVNTANYQRQGCGLSVVELEVADHFADELQSNFKASFKGMPVTLDVNVTMNRQAQNVITGFANKPMATVPAAA